VGLLDLLEHLKPVAAAKRDIEQNEVPSFVTDERERLGGRAGLAKGHGAAGFVEDPANAIANDCVIIDDEDAPHVASLPLGTRNVMVVPCPSEPSILSSPPRRCVRSRIPTSPSECDW
jgi:hypothetical protein